MYGRTRICSGFALIVVIVAAAACSRSGLDTPNVEPSPRTEAPGAGGAPPRSTAPAPSPSAKPAAAAPAAPTVQPPAITEAAKPPQRSDDGAAPPADKPDTGSCGQRVESDLPGASLRVKTRRCSYTLAELREGVNIEYEVQIAQSLHEVKPYVLEDEARVKWPVFAASFMQACVPSRDASNIPVAFWVSGGGAPGSPSFQLSCPNCDIGRCRSAKVETRDVEPGRYASTWKKWTGLNFRGGSDTGEAPKGPLPAGEYELTLLAHGSFLPEGATERRLFRMQTTRRIAITP